MQRVGVVSPKTECDKEVIAGFVVHIFDEVLRREVIVDAFACFGLVGGVVEEHTEGGIAISPCSPCFLIVGFERIGQVVVDDKAYIGFIDTHTESIGADHDADSVVRCLGSFVLIPLSISASGLLSIIPAPLCIVFPTALFVGALLW